MSFARECYGKTFELLQRHHRWFHEAIPLIASENVPSPAVREAIATDFGNRYAEGWPGEQLAGWLAAQLACVCRMHIH